MTFLLDTNVVSELRRPERAVPQLLAWAAKIAAADLFLSIVSILELEIGILSIERRDVMQGKILRSWLDHQVLPAFSGRILPVDIAIALRCASLHVPDPRPQRDSLIAATALVHGMIVVTRNVRDFRPMSVTLLNPWEPPSP